MICANCKKKLTGKDIDLNLLESAYGIISKPVNSYHVKLYQEEYGGWFDWYHTTGTIIANRNGATSNIGKTKNAEAVAKIITKHIQLCTL